MKPSLCAILLFTIGCGREPVRRIAPESKDAALYVDLNSPEQDLSGAIVSEFQTGAVPAPFGRMVVARFSDDLFPSDFQLRTNGLENYSRLSREMKQSDLYLFNPVDNYWPSEYYDGDRRLPFTSNFIIHLQHLRAGATRLEVFEYLPRVNAGRRWGLSQHAGPGMYSDIRPVAATTTDVLRLLELLSRPAR